jgi:hypothetical protein
VQKGWQLAREEALRCKDAGEHWAHGTRSGSWAMNTGHVEGGVGVGTERTERGVGVGEVGGGTAGERWVHRKRSGIWQGRSAHSG